MATRAAVFDVPKHHTRLWQDFSKSAEGPAEVAREGDGKVAGFGDGFMPEMFHRMFADAPREVPPEKRAPGAAVRAKLHALASELTEVDALRKRTLRNEVWSGMAATTISEKVASALPESKTPPPDVDCARRLLEGMRALERRIPGAVTPGELAEAEGKARGETFALAECAESIDESRVRTALREAVEEASERIAEADAALEAFGLGYGPGHEDRGGQTPKDALELARRVRTSPQLQRIVQLAGRLKALASAKRATKSNFARSEIVGVEPTDDFASLVPSELASLTHPLTCADLACRVSERAAVGYELKGSERLQKGPLVVGIDISGSMGGDKDVWAKAVALALLDAAQRDHRPFAVILFNGKTVDSLYFPKATEVDVGRLLKLLLWEPFGGCDFDVPIVPCLDTIEDHRGFGQADAVLITDAQADPRHAQGQLARADKLGAHVFGIIIGGPAGAMKPWAHETSSLSDVRADSEAVDLIFDGILP
jgi:uncharacterized protein with von Willebrand factor type A (vWA) domain